MYQVMLVLLTMGFCYGIKQPMLAIYRGNNKIRTYEYAIAKEKAYKKKMEELEAAEEEEE